MTRARREQVSLDVTPYYHVISRCVRRAFLCGFDEYAHQNYEHRRQWVLDRIRKLSGVFAIDLCAYAIMSNHYHLVLRIDRTRSEKWSNEEVIERWTQLFHGHALVCRMKAGESLTQAELQAVSDIVSIWRKRLSDLGWYMRCLNEHIARLANEEDECTGRFWEGRYKSQALLDEKALLTCMSYVDLNPIRSKLADTPETSDFTSIQERLEDFSNHQVLSDTSTNTTLLPFIGNERNDQPETGICFDESDYLTLVDWTGRAIRDDKRGAIPEALPPILERLEMDEKAWLDAVTKASHRYGLAKGPLERIRKYAKQLGKKWIRGQSYSRTYYRSSPI